MVFHSTDAMGASLANAFYVCDFRGRASRSGIYTFKVVNEGAGFRVVEHAEFLGGVGTPDLDFSYDGRLFIADWFGSWTKNGKGNVYTVRHRSPDSKERDATRDLFRGGFRSQSVAALARLLGHVDMRVGCARSSNWRGGVGVAARFSWRRRRLAVPSPNGCTVCNAI